MKNTTNYMRLIADKKILIISIALISSVFAVLLALFVPEKHIAETTFTVNRVNREASEDFQYDNYYSIQAAEFVSNSVVGILAAPDMVNEIYVRSGVENDQDAYARVKNIKTRQKTSHLTQVKVYDSSRENAEKVLLSAAEFTSDAVANLEQTQDQNASFELSSGDVVFGSTKVDPVLAGILGLLAGVFVGIAVAFLQMYLSEEEAK